MTPAEPARYADSTGDGGRHGQGPEKRNKFAACHRAPVNPAADNNRFIPLFREPGKPVKLHDGKSDDHLRALDCHPDVVIGNG